MENKAIKDKIIGTWRLIAIYYKDDNDNKTNLYGEDPIGILMYDEFGNMNAQLGYRHRELMSSAALSGGTKKEKSRLFDQYMAYYGKYYEKEPGVVIHSVEGCMIPNWEGGDQIRYAKVDGDLLYISAPRMTVGERETVLEVVWERCR
jgi:hypothetical protein